MRAFDQDRSRTTQRVKHDVVGSRLTQYRERRSDRGTQRTGAMRDLVLAMAHPLIADADRENRFVREHRGPELDVGGLLVEPPQMIAPFDDSLLDRALEI